MRALSGILSASSLLHRRLKRAAGPPGLFKASLGLCAALWLPACAHGSFGPDAPTLPPKVHAQSASGGQTITDERTAAFDDFYNEQAFSNPSEYTAAGYRYVDRACNAYFDNLILAQHKLHFAQDVTVAGGSGAATVLSLAKTAQASIGMVAAGFGFTSTILKSFDDRALLTPYPEETKALIIAALHAYRTDAPASSSSDRATALARVQDYAELCSYSGINRFAKQALATAKTGDISQEPNKGQGGDQTEGQGQEQGQPQSQDQDKRQGLQPRGGGNAGGQPAHIVRNPPPSNYRPLIGVITNR